MEDGSNGQFHRLDGMRILRTQVHVDRRGSLRRIYEGNTNSHTMNPSDIVQISGIVIAEAGTVKGPLLELAAVQEVKVVSCLLGCTWDVALDPEPSRA